MRQGDATDALYLVAFGRFAVKVDGRHIAEVGSGSAIGEIGFFADGIRNATVTALRDSIMLELPQEQFAGFAERHPAILKIGAGHASVPDASHQGLGSALSRFGEVAAVDSATLAAALPGATDLDSEAMTSWFNRQELRYHYVLYFADAELTPFSAKIIRQADQLLLVGEAKHAVAEPSLATLKSRICGTAISRSRPAEVRDASD